MNDLMIVLKGGGGWLYFDTDQTDVDKAFDEYCEAAENAGINIDNLEFNFAELRDNNGEAIGTKTF